MLLKGKSMKIAVVAAALTGIVCVAGGFGGSKSANLSSDLVEGKVALKMHADQPEHVVECGDTVEVKVELYVDEFFGRNTVMANPMFTNPTSTPRHVSYHIALFDRGGELIGCASQTSGSSVVDPDGGTLGLGSCLIGLEPEQIESIRSYQIRVYESDKEVGAGRLMASH